MAQRFRPNDFLAKPERFSGRSAALTHALPGFHTAKRIEQTLPYAQMKAVDGSTFEQPGRYSLKRGLRDYPVVVEVDMKALKPLPDIDGVRTLKGQIVDIAKETVHASEQSTRWGREQTPMETLDNDFESAPESMPGGGDDVLQSLFRVSAYHIERDSRGVLLERANEKPHPDAWLRQVARGKVSDADLLAMTGQMRYEADVASSRIVAIHYVRPWWPELIELGGDWGMEDDGRTEGKILADDLEAEGWGVWTVEDSYEREPSPVVTEVWRRPHRGGRVEYHGTSLHNLLSAAPELAKKLPRPPLPYAGPFKG